eukprot:scaffold155402_cov16-Tisochrysis_lutea.AAC.3
MHSVSASNPQPSSLSFPGQHARGLWSCAQWSMPPAALQGLIGSRTPSAVSALRPAACPRLQVRE